MPYLSRHDPMSTDAEAGISLLEVLVALVVLAIISMGVAVSTGRSYSLAKRAIREEIASELARSKLEELLAVDPSSLSAASSLSETGLVSSGISFFRNTVVTVNADNSRHISVTVAPTESDRGKSVTFQQTVSLWGVN